jgi:hypothetical protein
VKNRFSLKNIFAILVVLFCTTDFAFAKNSNIAAMKTIAVKFILAMLGIVFFSILMWVGLSLYNKFFVSLQVKDAELKKNSLRTPQDKDEAIMMFISKNRLKD